MIKTTTDYSPPIRHIEIKVYCDLDPVAQLTSALFDLLKDDAFERVPHVTKLGALDFVLKVKGE